MFVSPVREEKKRDSKEHQPIPVPQTTLLEVLSSSASPNFFPNAGLPPASSSSNTLATGSSATIKFGTPFFSG